MSVTIDGVEVVDLEVYADVRGSFVEFYRQSWLPSDRSALQGNISRSTSGSLRAMHFHRRQWDYWFVITGEMFVALADLRAGSPTERVISTMRLSAEEPRGLFIPPGVAHGFLAETDLTLGYLVDRYFDGTDEWGIAWNDPALGIEWPAADPVLSDRDRSNPSLSEALRDPIRYAPPVG
jgi:dTDP-4-dehydrorhamnose 3,5-epimerase